MTAYFSYIGDPNDPTFSWDRPDRTPAAANLPRRLIPAAWHENIGFGTLAVMRMIDEGSHEGRQLDWGAWGVRMTGRELRALFVTQAEYSDALAALDQDGTYILVAGEHA